MMDADSIRQIIKICTERHNITKGGSKSPLSFYRRYRQWKRPDAVTHNLTISAQLHNTNRGPVLNDSDLFDHVWLHVYCYYTYRWGGKSYTHEYFSEAIELPRDNVDEKVIDDLLFAAVKVVKEKLARE